MEDKLRWKTTFDGRHPLMEEDPRWKTNFNGRRLLKEGFGDSALPSTAVAIIFSGHSQKHTQQDEVILKLSEVLKLLHLPTKTFKSFKSFQSFQSF